MENIQVPSYYVVKPKLSEAELDEVQRALSITPCPFSILYTHDQSGYQTAMSLTREVTLVSSEASAHDLARRLAQETGYPVLIVGTADHLLDAVYMDGTKEKVC